MRIQQQIEPSIEIEMTTLRKLEVARRIVCEVARVVDPYTAYHLDNTCIIAKEIAIRVQEHFNLSDVDIEYIGIFSGLHDIGKIKIPNEVLGKRTPLNPTDISIIQTHPIVGKSIIDAIVTREGLQDFEGLDLLYSIVYHHHERLDGSGYPQGIKGDKISPAARIVAVADCYDAMVSKRSYRCPLEQYMALTIMAEEVRAGQLDEHCYNALLDYLEKK